MANKNYNPFRVLFETNVEKKQPIFGDLLGIRVSFLSIFENSDDVNYFRPF